MKNLNRINFIKQYLTIASPLIISNIVGFLIPMTDTYMVGGLGNRYLAAAQLANGIFFVVFGILVGMSFGVTSNLAYYIGTFKYKEAAKIFKHSVCINLCLALALASITFFSSPILYYLNGDYEVVRLATPYFMVIGFSMIPGSIHISIVRYLEAISKTKIVLSSNILLCTSNIFFNYIFINGKLGMPAMGLKGAGYGTLVARIVTVILLITYCLLVKRMYRYTFYIKSKIKYSKEYFIEILKTGASISLHQMLEAGFCFVTLVMIGYLTIEEQAANALIESIFRLVFSITWAFSTTSCVLISREKGKSDPLILKKIGSMCYLISASFIGIVLLIIISTLTSILELYNIDKTVIDIINGTKIIALLFAICDCVYMVGLGLLRGFQDTFIPFITTSTANWIVGLSIGYIFTFVVEMSIAGIWIGSTCSYCLVAVFLAYRFYKKANTITF